MESTNLSVKDFSKHYENKALGRLYFPNGRCFTPNGYIFEHGSIDPFNVVLSDLYRLLATWKVDNSYLDLNDIAGIIAFGSAVRSPGYTQTVSQRKKYFLFGPQVDVVKKELIEPADADFLVITKNNLLDEKVLAPLSLKTYDCGTWIQKGGIHLVNRGVDQVLNGIYANDTISISALREGVPVFFDERYVDLQKAANVKRETPRKLTWSNDTSASLEGRIE